MPGWAWLLIVLSVIFVLGVIAGISVPVWRVIQREKAEADTLRARKAELAKPITLTPELKQRAEAFAQEICQAIETSDGEALSRFTNTEAVADIIFDPEHLKLSPTSMKSGRNVFVSGFEKLPGGLFRDALGHGARPVRVHQRLGKLAITLRLEPEGGGVNYIDTMLIDRDGRLQVVDIFNYLLGIQFTTISQQAMAMMVPGDRQALARLLGVTSADTNQLEQLKELVKARQNGDAKAVLAALDALPPKLSNSASLFVFRLQALQSAQGTPETDAAYLKALEEAPSKLDAIATPGLLALDMYIIKGDYAKARQALDPVLAVIGEDAYLHMLQGIMSAKQGDTPAAEASLAKATALEPDLVGLYDLRMDIAAAKKDHPAFLQILRDLRRKTGGIMTAELLAPPNYAPFRSSPEYQTWLNEIKP